MLSTFSGRYKCDCLAAKHKLINNCTKCGRVVCEQEGSGPCIFCGELVPTTLTCSCTYPVPYLLVMVMSCAQVCSREEQEVLERGSKKSDKLRSSLMRGSLVPKQRLPAAAVAAEEEAYDKAVRHKNRLLEFDRTRFHGYPLSKAYTSLTVVLL